MRQRMNATIILANVNDIEINASIDTMRELNFILLLLMSLIKAEPVDISR